MSSIGALKKEHGFDSHQVKDIAEKTGRGVQTVYDVLCEKSKTRDAALAAQVSILTGKPPELYLVQGAVRIDPLPKEDWSWKKVDDQTSLCDMHDLDLLQLQREVMTLAAEIAVEMQRRVG